VDRLQRIADFSERVEEYNKMIEKYADNLGVVKFMRENREVLLKQIQNSKSGYLSTSSR
jgi:hypothetical protein